MKKEYVDKFILLEYKIGDCVQDLGIDKILGKDAYQIGNELINYLMDDYNDKSE
jgi:hypothetical protein